jgi:transcriptional regulator with XRE-family HTH domain
MNPSPEQVRAARNWLNWSQAQLAEQAKVGLSTVKDFESGKRVPIANNLEAIRRALEGAGMEFTPGNVRGPVFLTGSKPSNQDE